MKIENSIGWCDATTNAVTGCDKVSAGCKNCYAAVGTRARVLRSHGIETWGQKGVRYPVNFAPVFRRLNKLCVCDRCHAAWPYGQLSVVSCQLPGCGGRLRRTRLFADSNSDWLDERWPIDTLVKFLDAIRLSPNVDVLLLTKRPENFKARLIEAQNESAGSGNWMLSSWLACWLHGNCPYNLWFGVSVENQAMADLRIPQLLEIPAKVKFLSCEPLLESLNLVGPFEGPQACPLGMGIQWVIVGGESGKDRRDCGMEAIESIARECILHECPVYVKQDCAFKSGQQGRISDALWARKEFPNLTERRVSHSDT